MRRKGLWLSVLATALIAGNVSADITNNAGVYTYEGNGYNFFDYNTVSGTGVNSSTWAYGQVNTAPYGTRSNNEHFQQYSTVSGTELMDGWYTHGANDTSPDWNVANIPGGETSEAIQAQVWDQEQLFWNYVGNGTSGTLHIGIVTGFQSAGRDGYGAGDLFLAFGTSTIALPNSSEYPGGANGTDGFYELAIGTGDGRNTGSNEWVLGPTWPDLDSNPFDVESDPYRVAVNSGQDVDGVADLVDIANVEWSQNIAGNSHNFLAVALNLNGATNATHLSWIERLLGTPGPGGSAGGFTAHWTYGCGNDTIHYTAVTTVPFDNVVPVPAAAPMGLLGMGLLALVRRVRRRPEC